MRNRPFICFTTLKSILLCRNGLFFMRIYKGTSLQAGFKVLDGMVSNPLGVDDLSFGLVLNFVICIISVIK